MGLLLWVVIVTLEKTNCVLLHFRIDIFGKSRFSLNLLL